MEATGKLAKVGRIDAQILARPLHAILALRCQRSGMPVAAENRLIMAPSRWPSASAPTCGD